MTTEPCACGRTHARALGGLKGRNDELIKIRGLMFFPSVIEDSVRRLEEVGDEFKVEISRIDDMDRIRVTVEPSSQIPKASYASAAAKDRPSAQRGAGHRCGSRAGSLRLAAAHPNQSQAVVRLEKGSRVMTHIARTAAQATAIETAAETTCHLLVPLELRLPFWKYHGLFQFQPYSFLLDSAKDPEKLGRYSFLGGDPFLVYKAKRRARATARRPARRSK